MLRICTGNEEQCEDLFGQVGQQSERVAGNRSNHIGQAVEDWIGRGQTDITSYDTLDRPYDAPSHFVSAIPHE
jgi:hypothetical protein